MKRYVEFIWPAIGLGAVAVSLWILAREFKGQSVASDVWHQFGSIPTGRYALAFASALVAYAALAWYDRIALLHLGITGISLPFVAGCSFTTYALSHTIGASMFSGAMVRYRAYSTKGLSATQVGILVAVCSLTFLLGVLLVGGGVLLFEPRELARVAGLLPSFLTDPATSRAVGLLCLAAVAVYVVASAFRLEPVTVAGFRILYPRPGVVARQFIAAPLELIGAAGIIYFALPEAGNPGFFVVLAVFVASFSAALASNAPAGAGVFDLIFINALPGMPKATVLAAVLMFRFFYLLLPLAFAAVLVFLFERRRLRQARHPEQTAGCAPPPADVRGNAA